MLSAGRTENTGARNSPKKEALKIGQHALREVPILL